MDSSAIKIRRGMTRLLKTWHSTVSNMNQRLGWKVGFNMITDQQRMNLPSAMIGYLSRERKIGSGHTYKQPASTILLVEPEVAILIGCDVPENATRSQAGDAISGYCAALELVDTTRSVNDDIEAILSGNMFHEGVLFAEPIIPPGEYSREQLEISLCINGNEVGTLEQQRVPQDFVDVVCNVANILASYGENLKAGDWIITGAAAKAVRVQCGDNIMLDMGTLGKITLKIA